MQNTPPSPTPGPSISNPTSPSIPQQPSTRTPSKSFPLPKILIIILTIAVLALAGFLFFHFTTVEHTTSADQPSADPSASLSADALAYQQEQTVLTTLDKIKEKAIDFFVEANLASREETIYLPYTLLYDRYNPTILFQPSDHATKIQMDKSYALAIRDNVFSTNSGNYYDEIDKYEQLYGPKMTDYLTELGFTANGTFRLGSAGPEATIYHNQETGVICAGAFFWEFSCGHQNWYNKDFANLADELSKSFTNATDESVYHITDLHPAAPGLVNGGVKDSQISPYQTLTVGMNGSVADFYRVSTNDPWIFAFIGPMGPTCDDFDTQDLKNAFAGRTCWNTETDSNSTVQP